MDRDPIISVFFNLTFQALVANDELADMTEEKDAEGKTIKEGTKYNMEAIQKIVTSAVIEKSRKGDLYPPTPEKEGYHDPPPASGNVPQPGSYNPPWPKFNGEQIPRPLSWDGTELCLAPKWKGKPWSALPEASVKAYIDKNDNTKYHNKASWEMERRTAEDVDEPVEDDDIPF